MDFSEVDFSDMDLSQVKEVYFKCKLEIFSKGLSYIYCIKCKINSKLKVKNFFKSNRGNRLSTFYFEKLMCHFRK